MTPEDLKKFGAAAKAGPGVSEGDEIYKLASAVEQSGNSAQALELANLIDKDPSFVAEAIHKGGTEVTQMAGQLIKDATSSKPAKPAKAG